MSSHILSAAVVLAGVMWLYSGVLSSLVRQWASDDNYSHGFLIVPLALYCAWERRHLLAAAERKPHTAGLLIVLLSLVVYATGVFAAELFLTRISLVGVIVGSVLFVWGSAHARQLVFPLALLPLMVPLPALVFNQIAFPLQLLASRVGETTLAAARIPVLREGNILELPNTTLAVAEACSGIRSLISLVTLAIVLAYFTERRMAARVLIVLSAVPIAILANAARVAGTGFASHWFGPKAAEGFFHGFSGWIMFAVAFAGLIAVARGIQRVSLPWAPRWRRVAEEDQCSAAH
jgi:exosortase